MENIETLLAAVAQTQGFDDDELVAPAQSKLGTENSGSAVVAGVSSPSPAVVTPVSASQAAPQVIGSVEKRKRGRPPKAQPGAGLYTPPPKRIKVEDEDEDVCFICFDGGSLVLCDRKGCPKAYHPACIKRDEAFFQSTAKWNCGWHICSVCRKASYFTCYTCTYSLCKTCIKNEDFLCVRGNKGFCSTCIKPIMLIENKDQVTNDSIKVDFDDKLSWEYLFKMYWLLLKEKLSFTLNELTQAKNPWKSVSTTEACKPQLSNVLPTAVGREFPTSYRSTEPLELNKPNVDISILQNNGLRSSSNGDNVEKLQSDKEENVSSCYKDTLEPNVDKVTDPTSTEKATSNTLVEKDPDDSRTVKNSNMPCIFKNTNIKESEKPATGSEWASKDLLEFVANMKNGDASAISQFDVQTLLLDYIKRNNLRDPHRKSQIICDQRLKNLFGKPRVGHIEMLKLLEFHFLIKENPHKNSFIPAGFVSSVANDVESVGNLFGLDISVNSRKRKTRKKIEDRPLQHDLKEYAMIDVHNISLIYLRRTLMENLLDDHENFNEKVIGSIVRIRISTTDQKPEVHRLVQVVGTSKLAEPYKVGNRTADVMLEVLNLDKKEIVSIDGISNQEFTEEECRRLRQSIRCGFVKHFTVGEVQTKAVALQLVRVNDWLEAEVSKLNHLRDRASEKGRKKELREYVDRLQLLKSHEERTLRISEVPVIHADPKMNPNYESEEDSRNGSNGKNDEYLRPSYHPQFLQNGRKTSSNKKGKDERSTEAKSRKIDKIDATRSSSSDKHMNRIEVGRNHQSLQRSSLETSTATAYSGNTTSADNIETEKLWHYRDPNGKIQGPFSMIQLRKWRTTGLFPPKMRIWTNHEQYDSILLTDALTGKLHVTSDLSYARCSSGLQKNKSPEGVGVREGLSRVSGDSKQTEANGAVKVDESGSSGWPQCWDLLKDNNSNIDDVKVCSLPPPSSSEMRHAALSDRCPEGDDLNPGSHTGEKNEFQTQLNNENRAGKPSEENIRTLNIDLSSNDIKPGPVSAAMLETQESSKRAEDVDILGLPSPILKAENKPSVTSDAKEQKSGVLELLSPRLGLNKENEGAQATDAKQSEFVNLPITNSGPGWNGNVQLPEVVDEWCGYSPTPARPSNQEWDPVLVSSSSTKQPEVKIEILDQDVAHDSLSYPISNMPNWLTTMNEPIEFVALGEDSVSDLLAEVDAMESQGALPSPTAALKFARELLEDSKDDCFSSMEEFSSAPEPRRSDALSSTSNLHFTSQSSEPSKPNGNGMSPVDAFDFFRRSSANSSASSEGETSGSGIHPPPPSNANKEIIGATTGQISDQADPSWGPTLQGNINLVTVQGNVNLVLGGPDQGMTSLGWGTNPGHAWANPCTNRSPRNGSLPWDGPRKYGGGERFNSPREWGYQGCVESGFGRGRQPWGRQVYGGNNNGNGGYARSLPKGQRVCKFYEGGHCKKGAFCDYLHP